MTGQLAALLAALLAAAAVALLVPPRPVVPWSGSREGASGGVLRAAPVRVAVGGVLVLTMGLAVLGPGVLPRLEPVSLLAAGVTGGASTAIALLAARARQRTRAEQRRAQVVAACEALLGELRAGQPPGIALGRAAAVWPDLAPAVAAATLGSSVPAALRQVARKPGSGALVRVAAAWEVCAATGSGLGLAVERVLGTVRQEQATARLVAGELASARATARLVAVLPVVVLIAADGVGAQPWTFLFGTLPGVVCLGAGLGSGLLGLWWIDRIAAAAAGGG